MLGKKHTSKQEDWIKAWNSCTDMYSKEYIDNITDKAIGRLEEAIKTYDIDINRLGYGWSGGKDSLVVGDILRKSKYKYKGFCTLYPLYFKSFEKYCLKNKPSDVEIFYNNRYDFEFMNNNEKFLFNRKEKFYEWSQLSRPIENKFYKNNNLDLVIFGRRILDGNSIRLTNNLPIQITKDKKIFNIIYDWSHEELLAYIKYNNIELPQFYLEREGFKYGTHFWFERDSLGSLKDNMDEIFKIDKETVINAAIHNMLVAKEYLEGIGYEYTSN